MAGDDSPPPPTLAIDARHLVPFDDLVGRQEIAERLGVTVAAVDTWRRRSGAFPAPLIVLSSTPIWRMAAVTGWASRNRRRAGRPRKESA